MSRSRAAARQAPCPVAAVRERASRAMVCLQGAAALLVLATRPAHADPLGAPHLLFHQSPPTWLVAAAVATVALVAAAAARRPRNSAALCFAGLVALFGFESSLHSVHHLFDSPGAAGCAIFAGSHQAMDGDAETPEVSAPAWAPGPGPAAAIERLFRREGDLAHGSRAPPLALTAQLS